MKFTITCKSCGATVEKRRSPAQLERSGPPQYCSNSCQAKSMKRLIICAVDGCEDRHHAGGYCGVHYRRNAKNGDPLAIRRTTTEDSFWSRVDKNGLGGCWIWTGHIQKGNGYGKLATSLPLVPGGSRLAHRASYELHQGLVDKRLHIDHLCHVRACVNPAHLEPVTPKENTRRGLHGEMRTHCKRGHELTADNVDYDRKTNCRRCKTCNRERRRRRRASIRQAFDVAGRGVS